MARRSLIGPHQMANFRIRAANRLTPIARIVSASFASVVYRLTIIIIVFSGGASSSSLGPAEDTSLGLQLLLARR